MDGLLDNGVGAATKGLSCSVLEGMNTERWNFEEN